MRWLLVGPTVGLILASAFWSARCGEPPAQQTTQVAGTVPDLVGRWLVVAEVEGPTKTEPAATTAALWDVSAPGGTIDVTRPQVDLPPDLKQAVERANKERTHWEPSVRQLQDLRDTWQNLPVIDTGVGHVETKVTGSDAFDSVMKGEERMKGARFIIQQIVDFLPGGGRPIKDVYIYGGLEERPDGWSGSYMSAGVAPSPVPIPITLNGTFRAYRLESIPQRGLLARILDVFSGCGRR
jgi:hypothetical protein